MPFMTEPTFPEFTEDGPQETRKSLLRLSTIVILKLLIGINIAELVIKWDADIQECRIDAAFLAVLMYLIWKNWQFLKLKDEWFKSADIRRRTTPLLHEYVNPFVVNKYREDNFMDKPDVVIEIQEKKSSYDAVLNK